MEPGELTADDRVMPLLRGRQQVSRDTAYEDDISE
jgi:hypothetical protein